MQHVNTLLSSLGPRIVVIGAPGAGKSTVAKTLSRSVGVPVHHLDDLAWLSGWRRRPHEEFLDLQLNIVAGERWVVEGWHAPTLDVRLKSATDVVVLDVPALTCLWRFYSRAWRRWAHGDSANLPAPLQANHRRLQLITPDLRMIPRILTAHRRLRTTRKMIEHKHSEIRVIVLSTENASRLARSEALS